MSVLVIVACIALTTCLEVFLLVTGLTTLESLFKLRQSLM